MARKIFLSVPVLVLLLGVTSCGRTSLFGGPEVLDMGDVALCSETCRNGLTCEASDRCCKCVECAARPSCLNKKDGGTDGGGDGGNPTFCHDTCKNDVVCGSIKQCCACANCKDVPACKNDLCADKKNCDKPECVGDPRCVKPGKEICNNGIDDNDNGLVDCADSECRDFPLCHPHMCPSPPDCTDPACVGKPECQDLQCHPSVDFGTLQRTGSSVTKSINTTGTTDVAVTPCAPGGAGMVVTEFTLVAVSDVTLSFKQGDHEDHVFGLFLAGINQSCGSNPLDCYDPKSAATGTHTFSSLAAGHYYLIVQPFEPAGQGPATVTLSTATNPEICNNGVDDNGNGLIDCQDAECIHAANCKNQECVPDFNLGALVVGGGHKQTSFNTANFDANNDVTCQAAMGGRDVVVRFTLHETAGVLLAWSQSGDHVIALVALPDPGEPCDFNEIGCYLPPGPGTGGQLAWKEEPPGEYALIVKAIKPGTEGNVNIDLSAYVNRQQELCHNGIDDDGNGLIDCADPACTGVAGCLGPYCNPDQQLGTLNIGDSQTLHFDVAGSGATGYNTTCARGGAKGLVAQFTVGGTHGVAIGFDCTQTGDQVLDLFSAGGPRDLCDANEILCADPKVLPFGCGYEVPNLQPDTYNLIVEGFSPGSEGKLDLTLSISSDRQLEICNNHIDDDHDGFTDCADRKCATSPACAQNQCRPDQTIDPVPLTGASVFKLLQTSGNGMHAQLPCATPGGETATMEIHLTAAADLSIQWNQIGSHSIALVTNDGQTLSCDAGSFKGCLNSGGVATGMTSFTNVPSGHYYLIVAANGTSAGSVSLAISGMPH